MVKVRSLESVPLLSNVYYGVLDHAYTYRVYNMIYVYYYNYTSDMQSLLWGIAHECNFDVENIRAKKYATRRNAAS